MCRVDHRFIDWSRPLFHCGRCCSPCACCRRSCVVHAVCVIMFPDYSAVLRRVVLCYATSTTRFKSAGTRHANKHHPHECPQCSMPCAPNFLAPNFCSEPWLYKSGASANPATDSTFTQWLRLRISANYMMPVTWRAASFISRWLEVTFPALHRMFWNILACHVWLLTLPPGKLT